MAGKIGTENEPEAQAHKQEDARFTMLEKAGKQGGSANAEDNECNNLVAYSMKNVLHTDQR
jgi:hypothetical protein